jgi:lysine N6-hydroxylase
MGTDRVWDVIGVGLGPFNLGLAALADQVDGLDAAFFESRPEFSWHAGLMVDGARVQVPFLADLVTMADPTNPYSFLNYLHCRSRLYRFYFYEHFHIPRQEFEVYCRWVAESLPSCRFGRRVESVTPAGGDGWTVVVREADGAEEVHRAGAVVFGVGTRPRVPACATGALGPQVFHSADYLDHRAAALAAASVTVVGSGQSAAEVFADLLDNLPTDGSQRLDWFTRSRGFLPMEYSKLGLEHFAPEYGEWFQRLPETTRDQLLSGQDLLYKGISADTSARIYDRLYERTIDRPDPGVTYRSACELRRLEPTADGADGTGGRVRLHLHHLDDDTALVHDADLVVLATGHGPAPLPIDPALVEVDAAGRPVIGPDYRLRLVDHEKSTLFVQNGELHTHGIGAPDLGLGAHRNAVILNAVCGREVLPVRSRNVFQTFGSEPA